MGHHAKSSPPSTISTGTAQRDAFLRLELPAAAPAWPPPRLLALAGEAAEEDEDAAEGAAFGFWAACASVSRSVPPLLND